MIHNTLILRTIPYTHYRNELEKIKKRRILSYRLVPVIIGVILLYYYHRKEQKITLYLLSVEHSIQTEIEKQVFYLKGRKKKIETDDTYLTYSVRSEILQLLTTWITELDKLQRFEWFFSEKTYQIVMEGLKEFQLLQDFINHYNEMFISRRKKEYDFLFKKSPFPLDDCQKTAVITDDTNNLVVAGAGAGKTEVLTTRIAYLIHRKPDTIDPNRILALAFQQKASQEMKKRLKDRFGINTGIMTFHGLGYDILRRAGTRYNLLGENNHEKVVENLIKDLYAKAFENPSFRNDVIRYMGLVGNEEKIKEETDFETKEEFFNYQSNLRLITLNEIEVKSIGEQEIMNFFLSHEINGKSIDIRYEEHAEWMEYTNDEGLRYTPHPDFYLPDFDIYIEHWSIDNNGNPPKNYEGNYLQSMKIKQHLFKENKKTLVETTFGEFVDNPQFTEILKKRTLEAMKEKYPNKEFTISPTPYKKLVEQVWDDCKSYLKKLPKNISSYITIAKTYNLEPSDIEKRLNKEHWNYTQHVFGRIANTIYSMYEDELKRQKKIDFCDMINLAVDTLKQKPDAFKNLYDHILIDEFQDINMQRYELIKELMYLNPNCKLFCVGDDWQSIMGFSGSHLDFFVNFDKYFDKPARTDLTTNYRSIHSIVETGKEIIQKNEKFQLQKDVNAHQIEERTIQIIHSTHEKEYALNYYHQICEHCFKTIQRLLKEPENNYSPKDFMVLTRILSKSSLQKIFEEVAKQYKLPIKLRTVHSSKGLQARYVFLLNVVDDLYGFPCQLEDPTIFESARRFALDEKEAEERRLFYVAVTRAKENVCIYTQKGLESKFLDDIKKHVEDIYLDWRTDENILHRPIIPSSNGTVDIYM